MVIFEETSISVDWMDENPDFMGLKKHGMLKMEMLEYKQLCKNLSLKKTHMQCQIKFLFSLYIPDSIIPPFIMKL